MSDDADTDEPHTHFDVEFSWHDVHVALKITALAALHWLEHELRPMCPRVVAHAEIRGKHARIRCGNPSGDCGYGYCDEHCDEYCSASDGPDGNEDDAGEAIVPPVNGKPGKPSDAPSHRN